MDLLLIEDDDLIRHVLCEFLSESDCRIAAFTNAEAALDQLSSDPLPSVVVTDVNLGDGMTGLALGDVVRQRCSAGIVYISGLTSNFIGRELGPRERFVPKPFRFSDLLQAIADVRQKAPVCG